MMKIHRLIEERKSIRAFADKEIADDVLLKLFEAARWAPSSMNDQPWRFIVAKKNSDSFYKLLGTLNESNQVWAKNGAALILVVTKKDHSNGSSNKYAWHDAGLAIGNLTLQATAENVYLHQMGGFNTQVAMERFHVPDDYDAVTVIVLGYPGDPEELPKRLKERELKQRERKPLDSFVFSERFGEISELVK
jgi:nitroreductase